MPDLARSYLPFWGKAQPHDDAPHPWHPAAYHLLDVAAAVDEILRVRPLALGRGARLLGVSPGEARRLLVALDALHDVGKFARAFQAKRPDLGERVYPTVELARAAKTPHTADGYALWTGRLAHLYAERLWCGGGQTLDILAPAVFGHHGRPVLPTSGPLETSFGTIGVEAACAYTDALLALVLPDPVTSVPPSVDRTRVASWWVAGLLTVADWVGSHQEWFPYHAPAAAADALARYWDHARNAPSSQPDCAPWTPPGGVHELRRPKCWLQDIDALLECLRRSPRTRAESSRRVTAHSSGRRSGDTRTPSSAAITRARAGHGAARSRPSSPGC